MSDAPLSASSPRIDHPAGWTCRLAPDERIPEDGWAVDPGVLSAYVTTVRSDLDLRYEQTMWTVEKFAKKGWLVPGPAEDRLWPITFEVGSTGFAFVLSGVHGLHDMAQAARECRYDDSAWEDFTFPRADGIKRRIKGSDQWGRVRTFSWTCYE